MNGSLRQWWVEVQKEPVIATLMGFFIQLLSSGVTSTTNNYGYLMKSSEFSLVSNNRTNLMNLVELVVWAAVLGFWWSISFGFLLLDDGQGFDLLVLSCCMNEV